jgi:hypothetical protein
MSSCPIDYFYFPFETEKICTSKFISSIPKLKSEDCVVIYGGGGLIHIPSPQYNNGKFGSQEIITSEIGDKVIAWGVGYNVHGGTEINIPEWWKKYKMFGIRDNIKGYDWVPCASCMNPAFFNCYTITRDFVVYEHQGYKLNIPGLPKRSTHPPLSEALEFLGSANTIITNSYHGAYWGMLLGRKVLVCNPFSTKFYNIHPNIVFCDESNWKEKSKLCKWNLNFLSDCRWENKKYYNKVLSYLKGK